VGRLDGKAALVTGGGSGIGRAMSLRFAQEGAAVMVADVVADSAAETAETIALDGGRAASVAVDVTDAGAVKRAFEATIGELGGLDVVVNNAGVTIVGPAHELPEEEWDRGLAINLKSVYLVSRAAWPIFKRRGAGCIISTSSIAGLWGTPNNAAYGASKAAVIMLTKCMALDGARDSIRVNCVCPGFIDTPMIDGYFSDQPDPEATRTVAIRMQPLGRLGEPADVAEAFVYLASDESRWVTGSVLVVDGGLTSGIWSP
jgi:NAD(P)-dependent dehydrogenase (short-subunit alcohol dehydrogenase family)